MGALETFMEGKGRAIALKNREGMKRSSSDAVNYPITLGNIGYFNGDLF